MADPIPIGFLVSTLVTGGAERQLQHLILHLDRARFAPRLFFLREPGPLGEELISGGLPYDAQLAPGKPPAPWAPLSLARLLRARGIRLLYCLDHTNGVVVGTLAARLAGHIPVLVAVHTTGQWGKESIPRPMRWVAGGIHRFLSIAETQREYLVQQEGIDPRKIVVIRNGIPVLDPARLPSKEEARATLGIAPERAPVIGILAMLRPEKGHEHFLHAAAMVLREFPQALFLSMGDGIRRAELESLSRSLGLTEAVRFLGLRQDVARILPVLDLSVLASYPRVETLPLSQMEAMALEIPVVATRVGVLHELVRDGVDGQLVPPADPAALARAMIEYSSDETKRRAAGKAARQRILECFSIERVVAETQAVILQSLQG